MARQGGGEGISAIEDTVCCWIAEVDAEVQREIERNSQARAAAGYPLACRAVKCTHMWTVVHEAKHNKTILV